MDTSGLDISDFDLTILDGTYSWNMYGYYGLYIRTHISILLVQKSAVITICVIQKTLLSEDRVELLGAVPHEDVRKAGPVAPRKNCREVFQLASDLKKGRIFLGKIQYLKYPKIVGNLDANAYFRQ